MNIPPLSQQTIDRFEINKMRSLSELNNNGHEVSLFHTNSPAGSKASVRYYCCDHCETVFAFRTYAYSKWRHLFLWVNGGYANYDGTTCNDAIVRNVIE